MRGLHSFLLLFCCFSFSWGWNERGDNVSCPLPSGVVAPNQVIVGALVGAAGSVLETSVDVAIELINQDDCLLPETELVLVAGYDLFNPATGLDEFLRIQTTFNPVGWSGPAFSSVARSVAVASPLSETPTIASTASVEDLTGFPFFSRVIPSDGIQGSLLADLCDYYAWDRVATIGLTDPYAFSMIQEFTNQAANYKIRFLSAVTFASEENSANQNVYLEQIRTAVRKTKSSGARIIFLAAFSSSATDFFNIAIEEGLFGPPYTYLLADAIIPEEVVFFMRERGYDSDPFLEDVRGLISLNAQGTQPSPITDEWIEAWDNLETDRQVEFEVEEATPLSLLRDATYVLAWAIDRLIRRGVDPSDGNALLDSIQQETNFLGLTGEVILALGSGERLATFDIRNTRKRGSTDFSVIGKANESGLFFDDKTIFSDGTTNVPDAAIQEFVEWDDIEAIVMVTVFAIGILVTLICLVILMSHRSTPILNYASPRFVCGMIAGVLLGFSNIFVWTGEPTSTTCQLRPWLLMANFVMIFGHLYAKAFRFLLVMRQRKKLLFRPIPDLNLFLCVAFYLLVFSIPCIIWTAAFPLEVTRSDNNPDNDKVNIICDGENAGAFLGVLLALGGISLVVGVIIAFLNRNYHDFFSEATYIGYTMFTVCITCCVVLPMLFILDDTPDAFYIVLMLGIFLSNCAVVVFMFFPKIYVIFAPGKNVVPIDASGALKTKKSSTPPVGSGGSGGGTSRSNS